MGIISVNCLNFTYPQRKQKAVDDVSFVIEKGSYTAFVGYNGSGKSTIARLLCGLEKQDSGSIEIDKNSRIGIVFQSPKNQLVSGIVSRDTEFGPQNLGLSPAETELRTIESLNIVDMLDRAGSSTSALSLGQTQKVALSGVIALRPDILILDEAVSMLDPASRKDILDFIKYWHKCGNTIIQITHDPEIVKEADNVIGMENGRIFFYGTKTAFFEHSANVKRISGKPIEKNNRNLDFSSLETSLKINNLNFVYDKVSDKKHGVSNISFDLYKGTITALTGPSGAGKSTILELCSGLLKGEGNIYVSGKRPVLAQQNAQAALFENFAADDVAFGPRNNGYTGKKLKDIVKKSMENASIPFDEFGERRTFALSGGEQRRLSIAGILALDSDILLFDEPTAGLDSVTRYKVLMMFKELAAEGKTIVFSTHQRDEADFADREIRIEKGCVVSDSLSCAVINRLKEKEMPEIKPYDSVGMVTSLRNISLGLTGARKKKKSPLEHLHPALRILLFFALFIPSLAFRPILLCLAMVILSVIYCIVAGFSLKKLLKASLKILPFLLFFSIFQMIFYPALPDEVRFTTWRWFMVTPSKILFCISTILRTEAALACISAFFISTPEYDLIDGMKVLLKPLSINRITVRYFILIVEIVFRFIPLLVDEACSILKTQLIRGGLGKAEKLMAKIKAVVPLIAPLIIQTIKRSEALADAITMRCFK